MPKKLRKLLKYKKKKYAPKKPQTVRSSKLEILFRDKVLESLQIKYIHQYQIASKIFDFYLPEYRLLIEVDGDYWHGNTKGKLNEMQKKNIKNDKLKNRIASFHKYNLIRFSEGDIHKNLRMIKLKLTTKISEIQKNN